LLLEDEDGRRRPDWASWTFALTRRGVVLEDEDEDEDDAGLSYLCLICARREDMDGGDGADDEEAIALGGGDDVPASV
jgi:hypothetical protein